MLGETGYKWYRNMRMGHGVNGTRGFSHKTNQLNVELL